MAVFDLECLFCGHKWSLILDTYTHDYIYENRYFCAFCGTNLRSKNEKGQTFGRVLIPKGSKEAVLLELLDEV